jgi:hypothetical protein
MIWFGYTSVADPGCLSRIPDPDFYTYRIPDLGSRKPGSTTATKERGKKICCHTIFCSHKFHKIEIYFIFEMLKKIICGNFQRIIKLFTQKIGKRLSKIWVWDPGSEIRDPEKTYSGSRNQKGTGSRIRIRNLGLHVFCFYRVGELSGDQEIKSQRNPELSCSSSLITSRTIFFRTF